MWREGCHILQSHQHEIKIYLPRKAKIFLVLNKTHRGWDWAPLVCREVAMALLQVPLQVLLSPFPLPAAALSIQALLSPSPAFFSLSVQSLLPAITTRRKTWRHETTPSITDWRNLINESQGGPGITYTEYPLIKQRSKRLHGSLQWKCPHFPPPKYFNSSFLETETILH